VPLLLSGTVVFRFEFTAEDALMPSLGIALVAMASMLAGRRTPTAMDARIAEWRGTPANRERAIPGRITILGSEALLITVLRVSER
jgi:hypothetical protein